MQYFGRFAIAAKRKQIQGERRMYTAMLLLSSERTGSGTAASCWNFRIFRGNTALAGATTGQFQRKDELYFKNIKTTLLYTQPVLVSRGVFFPSRLRSLLEVGCEISSGLFSVDYTGVQQPSSENCGVSFDALPAERFFRLLPRPRRF